MTIEANVLNGFKQPNSADNTSDLKNDSQFFLYGTADINGTTIIAEKMKNVFLSNDITVYSDAGAVNTSGMALIVSTASGYNMTLAAPAEGCFCRILVKSIIVATAVVVTTASGVTYDGTNNRAVFEDVDDELIFGYKSPTEWQIYKNVNVVLNTL